MKLVCLQYHNVERQPPSTLFSRYRSRQSVLLKTKKFETTWAGEKMVFGLHIDTLMGSGSHTELTLSTGLKRAYNLLGHPRLNSKTCRYKYGLVTLIYKPNGDETLGTSETSSANAGLYSNI